MTNDYITVIGTDPQYGHDLMHSDAQPWAVAQVVLADDGAKLVVRVFSRHATHKGAMRSATYRRNKK